MVCVKVQSLMHDNDVARTFAEGLNSFPDMDFNGRNTFHQVLSGTPPVLSRCFCNAWNLAPSKMKHIAPILTGLRHCWQRQAARHSGLITEEPSTQPGMLELLMIEFLKEV